MAPRKFDIILFGATGFAGELTAQYLARNAPTGCRWALAGRNPEKLEAVRARLAQINPALAKLPLRTATIDNPLSLQAVAQAANVVISTVGPYVTYGEPMVAACAEVGTDYLDLTGEPEFVDTMYVRHHDRAVQTGARLIHSCGFDSVPHDLGVYFTVQHLPENVPLQIKGYVRASAAFSGGTYHSAITGFSRTRENIAAARDRRRIEPRPDGRIATHILGSPHRDTVTDGWAVPLPTIDPKVVIRSARALPEYGPSFQYSHFASIPHLWAAAAGVAGVGAMIGLAQIAPARRVLLNRVQPGEGPSAAKRAKSWFTVTFVGEGGGVRVVTRVSGGDPGYDETAKMLAESALALAFDDLPSTAGQITPAAAMGAALLDRLQTAGLSFEVLTPDANTDPSGAKAATR